MATITGQTVRTTPFLDSTELLGNPAALRSRADEHGYLYFRNLLPADDVLDVRRRFLEILRRSGWLTSANELMDGIADLDAFERTDPQEIESCGVGVTPAIYREVQRVRQFHELAHHPRLLAIYQDLFGAEVFPHPRNIARLMINGRTSQPTPPHQDFIHVQGARDVWTAWIPLGDCSSELGALTILDGSNRDGLLSYKASAGAGGLEAYLCSLDLQWAQGDFAAGDVVTFHSQTVHKALPNRQGDRVRLSCDFRYQRADDEIEERSLRPHCEVMTWDDVYQGWPENGIQWYWRGADLKRSEWDEGIRWQQKKIC